MIAVVPGFMFDGVVKGESLPFAPGPCLAAHAEGAARRHDQRQVDDRAAVGDPRMRRNAAVGFQQREEGGRCAPRNIGARQRLQCRHGLRAGVAHGGIANAIFPQEGRAPVERSVQRRPFVVGRPCVQPDIGADRSIAPVNQRQELGTDCVGLPLQFGHPGKMGAVEKFVGGQKGIMKARALIGIDRPAAELPLETGLETATGQGVGRIHFLRNALFDIGSELRPLIGHETACAGQRLGQLRRNFRQDRGQRQHLPPAVRRRLALIHALLELGHAQLRHEIALVDVDRSLQRVAFSLRIAQAALRRGGIEPQCRFARVGRGSRPEMAARLRKILLPQRDHAQHIERLRLARVQSQRIAQERRRIVIAAALPRRRRLLQQRRRARPILICLVLFRYRHGDSLAQSRRRGH